MSRTLARAVGPVLLALGAVLVIWSVLAGAASVALLLIVPVVTGSSALFLVGVVLLFLGVLLLPLAFADVFDEPYRAPSPSSPHAGTAPSEEIAGGGGGLILIGPVPVFFGSWKNPSRAAYWAAVLVGALALAIVLLVLFGVP